VAAHADALDPARSACEVVQDVGVPG